MNDNDAKLHQVLQEGGRPEPLPPRFDQRVWQRIARLEEQRPQNLLSALLNQLGQAFIRPSLAATYVAVLLIAGLSTGLWQARVVNLRTSQEWGARYVHMMDPYQAPTR